MSAKRCKALRQALRRAGHDLHWRPTVTIAPGGYPAVAASPQLALDPRCGRAIYRAMKGAAHG